LLFERRKMTKQSIETTRKYDGDGYQKKQVEVDFKNGPVVATYSQEELQILGNGDAQIGFQKVRRAMREQTDSEALPGRFKALWSRSQKRTNQSKE
jgi:hypothetical protein